jgi:hypothetical protein
MTNAKRSTKALQAIARAGHRKLPNHARPAPATSVEAPRGDLQAMAERHRQRMAAVASAPPARRTDVPAVPMPRTDPETIAALVKIGFSTSEISSAAEMRRWVYGAIVELNARDRELAAARKAIAAYDKALPVAVSRAMITAAATAKRIYAPA